jgi:hypothetical protein
MSGLFAHHFRLLAFSAMSVWNLAVQLCDSRRFGAVSETQFNGCFLSAISETAKYPGAGLARSAAQLLFVCCTHTTSSSRF